VRERVCVWGGRIRSVVSVVACGGFGEQRGRWEGVKLGWVGEGGEEGRGGVGEDKKEAQHDWATYRI
jgi:hypothetical protein